MANDVTELEFLKMDGLGVRPNEDEDLLALNDDVDSLNRDVLDEEFLDNEALFDSRDIKPLFDNLDTKPLFDADISLCKYDLYLNKVILTMFNDNMIIRK